jgi:hypothetical protein
MYFCPKCNYSFDISKASTIGEDTRKKLDTPESALKRLKAGKQLNNYMANFEKDMLENNKIYLKLSDDEKHQLNILFESATNYGGIEFKCNNCNYRKRITETIKLYQMNVNNTTTTYRSAYDNKLLAMNPIYPRTKDYTCKNINCITHKDGLLREAIFFREKDSYLTNYVCTICHSGWKI